MPVAELEPVQDKRLTAQTRVSEAGPRVLFIQPVKRAEFNAFRTEEGEPVGEYPEWITDWVEMPVEPWYVADKKQRPSLVGVDFIISGGSTEMPDKDSNMLEEMWALQDAAEELGILGHDICFSHQARARRRDGSVGRMDNFRFGIGHVTLTREGMDEDIHQGLDRTFPVFQSNLMVVTKAGEGDIELARSNHHNESLRTGNNTSSQYHPEGTTQRWKALARSKREANTLRVPSVSGKLVVPNERQYKALLQTLDTFGPDAERNGKTMGANIKQIAEAQYASRVRGLR